MLVKSAQSRENNRPSLPDVERQCALHVIQQQPDVEAAPRLFTGYCQCSFLALMTNSGDEARVDRPPDFPKNDGRFIMKLLRLAAAVSAAAALALSGAAASTAAPTPESTSASSTPIPRIIGGNAADISKVPFAALQLVNGQANCSGSQISATWVLTAKHCIANQSVSKMSIQLGSATIGSGTVIKAKRALGWADGDVALIELASPYKNTYSALGASNPAKGAKGDIYGWGAIDTTPTYPDYLKTAKVTVVGTNNSNWPGPAIVEKGDNGQALWGDSGGPLIVNGKQVGVCSGPLNGDPGTISGTVMYASTVAAASWIKSTSGVSAS